jgi:hypothetical protein
MTLEGEISDLSLGGAFFASELLDEPDTTCYLLILPSPDGEVVRFSAVVVRIGERERPGLGLRFVKMTAAAQNWLIAALES